MLVMGPGRYRFKDYLSIGSGNGRYRLAARHVGNADDLEVLIQAGRVRLVPAGRIHQHRHENRTPSVAIRYGLESAFISR